MAMKPLPILATILLLGSSCSRQESEGRVVPAAPTPADVAPPSKSERRPFKGLIDSLDGVSETQQKYFLSHLAKGLRAGSRDSRETLPHWGDLIEELFERGKPTLLYHLLRDPSLDWNQLSELAIAAGKRGDRIAFVILLDVLDESEGGDERTVRPGRYARPSAVIQGVGKYLSHSWSEPRAYQRLVEILQGRSDAVLRGLAATCLGDSSRSEVEGVLTRALGDHASVPLDHNQSADGLETVASRAEESLKRLRKSGGESGGLH